MPFRTPEFDELENARAAYQADERRELFYRTATELVDLAIRNQISLSLAEVLTVLLQRWNQPYNRYSRFDEVTPLHPTPVYETLLGVIGFFILLWIRRKPLPDGAVFMFYLLLASLFRFLVEFLRLQPKLVSGLSEAQLFAAGLFALGLAGLYLVFRRNTRGIAPA